MRRQNSKITVDFISEKGMDVAPKTFFAFVPLENMALYAAAESCDDDTDLNSAQIAVESVIAAFERKPSLKKIGQYIQYAHDQVKACSVKNKLEAAVTVVVTDYTRIRYASCGNVKFFLLSAEAIIEKSETQTYQDFASREYGETVLFSDENRNLLQFLGKDIRPKVKISKKILLPEECTILLTTCGFWERVDEIEILDTYEESKPDALLETLNEQLLLTQLIDPNIRSYTIAAMFVEKPFREDTMKIKKRRRRIIIFSVILSVLAVTAIIVLLIIRSSDRRALNEIERLNSAGLRYMNLGNFAMAHEQYSDANERVDNLRNNWQFRREKRELTDEVLDNLQLTDRIVRGDRYLEDDNFGNARLVFQEAYNLAEIRPNAEITDALAERRLRADLLITVDDLVHIADMYMFESMYLESLARLLEAEQIARDLGDLPLRRDMMARIFEINRIIDSIVEVDFIQHIQSLMERAESDLNFLLALQYSEFIISIYDDLGIVSPRAHADRDRITQNISLMAIAADYATRAVASLSEENFIEAINYYEMVLVLYGEIGISIAHERYRYVVDEILRIRSLIRELDEEAAAAAQEAAEIDIMAIVHDFIGRAVSAYDDEYFENSLRYFQMVMVLLREQGFDITDGLYRYVLDEITRLEEIVVLSEEYGG